MERCSYATRRQDTSCWLICALALTLLELRKWCMIYGADYVLREALLRGYFDGDGDWK